jgi:hypothetical protein
MFLHHPQRNSKQTRRGVAQHCPKEKAPARVQMARAFKTAAREHDGECKKHYLDTRFSTMHYPEIFLIVAFLQQHFYWISPKHANDPRPTPSSSSGGVDQQCVWLGA